MYVIKYKQKYVVVRSYSTIALVDTPEKATLYSRLRDAERRKADYLYLKRTPVPTSELEIYEVTFTFTERKL